MPAAKNIVTSKASHVKNPGKQYFYFSRKSLKPVAVKLENLDIKTRLEYLKACKFFQFVIHD
jgi:hypothetical protein